MHLATQYVSKRVKSTTATYWAGELLPNRKTESGQSTHNVLIPTLYQARMLCEILLLTYLIHHIIGVFYMFMYFDGSTVHSWINGLITTFSIFDLFIKQC